MFQVALAECPARLRTYPTLSVRLSLNRRANARNGLLRVIWSIWLSVKPPSQVDEDMLVRQDHANVIGPQRAKCCMQVWH